MRRSNILIAIVAALTLPSCTAYMHEGRHARCRYAEDHRAPCEHAREGEHGHGIIGIAITRTGESGRGPLVVAHVLPESPADAADIRPGDRIRAIDGESTRGMTLAEAARLIRGRADTAVELRVESPQGARLVTLVRVRSHAPCEDRHGRHHGDCDHHECRRHRETEPPAETAPPATDQSLAPELWPPTKPGHSAP
jgi:membrane-associated protease RseP (regulator of RpoE activity)